MMRSVTVVLLLAAIAGCDGIELRLDDEPVNKRPTPTTPIEYPTVNLPYALRQANWRGNQGEGSCVYASMISLFRWQGRYATADHWRRAYGNGEWAEGLADKMECEGVRFAYTVGRSDVGFLEWACSTRRGCSVTVLGGRHMICLVHFDEKWAGILDNNQIDKITWVPRQMFLAEWLNSNSWAVAIVYGPVPPLPY